MAFVLCLKTLETYIKNAHDNPTATKYHRIKCVIISFRSPACFSCSASFDIFALGKTTRYLYLVLFLSLRKLYPFWMQLGSMIPMKVNSVRDILIIFIFCPFFYLLSIFLIIFIFCPFFFIIAGFLAIKDVPDRFVMSQALKFLNLVISQSS